MWGVDNFLGKGALLYADSVRCLHGRSRRLGVVRLAWRVRHLCRRQREWRGKQGDP